MKPKNHLGFEKFLDVCLLECCRTVQFESQHHGTLLGVGNLAQFDILPMVLELELYILAVFHNLDQQSLV